MSVVKSDNSDVRRFDQRVSTGIEERNRAKNLVPVINSLGGNVRRL